MEKFAHTPVLLDEVIQGLNIKRDGCYVDATLGRGGHTLAILSHLSDEGHLYAFDLDNEAIEAFKHLIHDRNLQNCHIFQSNFNLINYALATENVEQVDGILFDLGVSSPQLDNPVRGFSYRYNARLDMRMDVNQKISAFDIVNNYSEASLKDIFQNYGESPFATRIAHNIVTARAHKTINSTFELVDVIKKSLPQKVLKKSKHPAKQYFQALRIAVNNELNNLTIALRKAIHLLAPKGRLVVISFHSLEDRIVKNFFLSLCRDPHAEVYKKLPYRSSWQPKYRIVTKKAIIASDREMLSNRRSHSAKLRILERL